MANGHSTVSEGIQSKMNIDRCGPSHIEHYQTVQRQVLHKESSA